MAVVLSDVAGAPQRTTEGTVELSAQVGGALLMVYNCKFCDGRGCCRRQHADGPFV